MIAHMWPDAASRALQLLFGSGEGGSAAAAAAAGGGGEGEEGEPPAVKAELLRVLTCVLAQPPQNVYPAGVWVGVGACVLLVLTCTLALPPHNVYPAGVWEWVWVRVCCWC